MDPGKLPWRGNQILNNPLLNKGVAFTQKERDALGLNGILPGHIATVEEQLKRCRANYLRKRTPLGKYVYLASLQNRNEILFFQFLAQYPAEVLPIIYTPTVGEASVQYSMIYSHQRGAYFSYPLRERMEEMVANLPHEDVQVIVATDGERILGLGDQGVGGMAISIGKLALYTLFGGIHPAKTLPVVLDVGTNNEELLNNDLYVGWHHKRIQGAEYDHFIERFVRAIHKRYPQALLQWEDFGKTNAYRILDRYKKEILSFNDDIQGTGAVALAALLSAVKVTRSKLSEQRIAILGGGSAGLGIAGMIVQAMMQEGLSKEDAARRLFIVDMNGLLHTNLAHFDDNQRPFLHSYETLRGWKTVNPDHITLREVIENAHPTVLYGVCGQGGAFTKEMISEMAKHVERPIIFPLSNPTSKAECIPGEAIEWTHGRAILATGSPFVPVEYLGRKIPISQCNNVYIFPGLGLGALAAEATEVTDGMLLEAARILANYSPALRDPSASLFPAIEQVREVSQQIALGVAEAACREKVARAKRSDLERRIEAILWTPAYSQF